MKACFTILMLCLAAVLYGQKGNEGGTEGGGTDGGTGAECSVNAGPDQIICYNEPLVLSAPASLDYSTVHSVQWSTSAPFGFANPNSLTTAVTGGPNWPVGQYTFTFCAYCRDLNNDGVNDYVCDDMVVTITPEPTQPVITEPDGTQDGQFTVCSEADITVTAPASGEIASVSVFPDDNLVTATITGNTVHLVRQETNKWDQGECTYEISYVISNGGCLKKAVAKVTFIKPYDPNGDGVIEGYIDACPSCNNTLFLYGDRPGCGGQGVWSVVSGPAGYSASFGYTNPVNGDAQVTVSLPGNYVFQYNVTNIAPCPNSTFQISCSVYQIGTFSLGNDVVNTYCDNVVPAGTRTYTFNSLSNALYTWQLFGATSSQIGITPGNTNSANVTFFNDFNLGSPYIEVTATKYFIDPDCEGPKPLSEVVLPSNDPVQNQAYIQGLLNTPGICIYSCKDVAYIFYFGAPKLNINSEDIYFLCSDGSETVRLRDYFQVTNGSSYSTNVTVVGQPGNSLPSTVSADELLNLTVEDCGEYIFEIEVASYNYQVSPPLKCSSTGYLTITIEEAKPVTAGTDQVKCCNEPIRLNGNDPFSCGAVGTWKLLSCSNGCTVTIVDPHDPNTQIYVNESCEKMPVTLQLEWSFASQDASCDLSDVTEVVVDDCVVPCDPLDVTVSYKCKDGQITLTASGNGYVINPYTYSVSWVIDGVPYPGNPVTVTYPGTPVNYSVNVAFTSGTGIRCQGSAEGVAACVTPPSGCGISILESCDDCGNVVLTAVDANGNVVPYAFFKDHFRWVVYSGPDDLGAGYVHNNVNPITVHPGACYSLLYEHFTYAPGGQPIPGTWIDYCRWELPKTCVTTVCPGPCRDFPDFFIAGCGDILDLSLGLTFPAGCQNVCYGSSTGGTLGVFHATPPYLPVDPTQYNILWENGSTGTYVNGLIVSINTVRITSKTNPCCFWEDGYKTICCGPTPQSIQCEQPIVKYCHDDGTYTYIPGPPQISWIGVAGANAYELEITVGGGGGEESCCPGPGVVQHITVPASPFVFPDSWSCFTIRVRALYPEGTCETSEWSDPYTYCAREIVCTPVITVCGCCHGERGAEDLTIQTRVVEEEELLAYMKAHPGTGYSNLRDALTATGFESMLEPRFRVFPNPASETLTIRPAADIKGAFEVEVRDMLQRSQQKQQYEPGQDGLLNISDLPKGVYMLTIRNAGGELLQTEKVTVIR